MKKLLVFCMLNALVVAMVSAQADGAQSAATQAETPPAQSVETAAAAQTAPAQPVPTQSAPALRLVPLAGQEVYTNFFSYLHMLTRVGAELQLDLTSAQLSDTAEFTLRGTGAVAWLSNEEIVGIYHQETHNSIPVVPASTTLLALWPITAGVTAGAEAAVLFDGWCEPFVALRVGSAISFYPALDPAVLFDAMGTAGCNFMLDKTFGLRIEAGWSFSGGQPLIGGVHGAIGAIFIL